MQQGTLNSRKRMYSAAKPLAAGNVCSAARNVGSRSKRFLAPTNKMSPKTFHLFIFQHLSSSFNGLHFFCSSESWKLKTNVMYRERKRVLRHKTYFTSEFQITWEFHPLLYSRPDVWDINKDFPDYMTFFNISKTPWWPTTSREFFPVTTKEEKI